MTSSHKFLIFLLAISTAAWEYDEQLTTQHAALSFAAYCPNSALTNWSVGYVSRNYPDMKNVQVFESVIAVKHIFLLFSQGTKGYIGYNSKLQAITIVFRGSSNVQNWMENINFTKTKYNTQCGCNVHKGFYDAY